MYKEFILRDGEIAFNMPDGTVTIMNVNTYLQLQKALKEQEEEGPSFFEVAVGLLLAAGTAADPEDPSDPKPENKKVLTDEAFKKWARLPENKDKVDNTEVKTEEEKQENVLKGYIPNFKVPGNPWSRDGMTIYVDSYGNLFRSGAELERYHGLSKGSVSSFLCGRQKSLYSYLSGYPKKIGVAVSTNMLFNTPAHPENYKIKYWNTAYKKYRTVVNLARQSME